MRDRDEDAMIKSPIAAYLLTAAAVSFAFGVLLVLLAILSALAR